MIIRKSKAEWKGDLKTGAGNIEFGSGAYNGPYSFNSRFADGTGTNPEELIAAAHSGCFSMAFSLALQIAGYVATRIHTTASVNLEPSGGGFAITGIDLVNESVIPGISDEQFQVIAADAKANCPVSKALSAVPISLRATLVAE
ncbi:MAG TPA: OsmC family protein [Bryobacteraceae bacterium]|nr:OsmC family protein [Bryobacteraceae bacterium]